MIGFAAILWLGSSLAIAYFAQASRNRTGAIWFFIAAISWAIVAFVVGGFSENAAQMKGTEINPVPILIFSTIVSGGIWFAVVASLPTRSR